MNDKTKAEGDVTAVLRVVDSRVSKQQVGVIMAIVLAVAGAVAGWMSSVHSGQLDRMEVDHRAAVEALERAHEDRVVDLKDGLGRARTLLDACLGREESTPR
jgi:hypothetical protein